MLRNRRSSSQDGGVGRNPSLPCTNKRRIITNLKSINNQKCQKIKLHGTPTNKNLKKKINQNNQTSKAAHHIGQLRKTWVRQMTRGWGWLMSKLRLRADCGLPRLLRWEKLPVSHRILWKVG